MVGTDTVTAKRWLDDFARSAESSAALDRLVHVIDDRVLEALPEFHDPTLRAELAASTRSHWKGFLGVVSRESIEFIPAPQMYDLARTLARRGYDLTLLLATYRIGQRAVWEFIADVAQTQISDPALRSAVLLQFWSNAARWIDATIESLIVAFTEEREQWQRGMLARRASVVNTILAGNPVDLDAAAATLGYPLRQHHTAFTLVVDECVPDSDVQRLIESAARTVSNDVGGSRPLIISSGARAAWCWTATPKVAVTTDTPRMLQGVRGTAGICHNGLDGFRLSHSEAVAALQVADYSTVSFVRFEDVEIACLAAGIVGAHVRAAFVRRELGDLADSDDASVRLRDTLRAYLKQGGDATATGASLSLHPNTVRYRIRQAEKKLGHPISRRRVHIEVALEIIGVFGSTPNPDNSGPPFCHGQH
jgi:hypothetical protein